MHTSDADYLTSVWMAANNVIIFGVDAAATLILLLLANLCKVIAGLATSGNVNFGVDLL